MRPKISILVSSRKNSKYLSKFLNGYFRNTYSTKDIEVLVMLNKDDTWNSDLVDFWQNSGEDLEFFKEDYKLGRAGLHLYFNELYKYARGDWIIYFCDDHYISVEGWDIQMRQLLAGTLQAENAPDQPISLQHSNGELDPAKIWCITPKFDNAGPMNHMLSRAMIDTMGGNLAHHGNLDSYLNEICFRLPRTRRIFMDRPLFHDFTHDHPSPMSEAHSQSELSQQAKEMPSYDDPSVMKFADADVESLRAAIDGGL